MADVYQPGHRGKVRFVLDGGSSGNVLLNVKGYSLDEEGTFPDVSGTSHGGRTARIMAKGDHKGSVTLCLDIDAAPFTYDPDIRAGTNGLMRFYVSANPDRYNQVPVIVSKVHYESAVEGEIRWGVDVMENILAGNGTAAQIAYGQTG